MNKLRDNRIARILICGAVVFGFFMYLQLRYIYDVWFDPDEMDIYTVAYEMFMGKKLYTDIPSQHMPFTYLISMVFYALGAREVYLQRLFFYVLFAGFWTGFVFRYKRYISKWVLILPQLLFFTFIQNQDFSTQILSENLALIGAQIFLFEFIRFLKEKDIDICGCILMCVAVLFTFGTSFITVFPLFFMGLGVLLTEIKWRVESKQPRKEWWLMMLKRYGRLFGIVLLPWVIFLIYLVATGSLGDLYFESYVINRIYYPKYHNGVGGSTYETFLMPVTMLAKQIAGIELTKLGPLSILQWITVFSGALFFPYRMLREKGVIAGFTFFLYTLAFGIRGYFNYHGKSFVMLVSVLTVYVLVEYAAKNARKLRVDDLLEERDISGLFGKGLIAVVVILTASLYLNIQTTGFVILYGSETNYYATESKYVEKLTTADERIWQTNISDGVAWAARRVTTGPSVSCPWMWEGVGLKEMEKIKADPPRVIVFQKNYESWGHKMSDYAPEAYKFIIKNYKYMPGSNMIWVRNDYYDEACDIMGVEP